MTDETRKALIAQYYAIYETVQYLLGSEPDEAAGGRPIMVPHSDGDWMHRFDVLAAIAEHYPREATP